MIHEPFLADFSLGTAPEVCTPSSTSIGLEDIPPSQARSIRRSSGIASCAGPKSIGSACHPRWLLRSVEEPQPNVSKMGSTNYILSNPAQKAIFKNTLCSPPPWSSSSWSSSEPHPPSKLRALRAHPCPSQRSQPVVSSLSHSRGDRRASQPLAATQRFAATSQAHKSWRRKARHVLSDRCSPQAADTTGNAEIQRIQRWVSFRNMANAEIVQNGSNLSKLFKLTLN